MGIKVDCFLRVELYFLKLLQPIVNETNSDVSSGILWKQFNLELKYFKSLLTFILLNEDNTKEIAVLTSLWWKLYGFFKVFLRLIIFLLWFKDQAKLIISHEELG